MKNILKKMKSFIKNEDPNSKVNWSLYKRVWNDIGKPHIKLLAAGIVCTVIAAGAEAYSITLIQGVIDKSFIEKNKDALLIFGLLIIISYTIKSVFGYIKIILMTKAGLLGVTSLRKRLYHKMVHQTIDYFHNTPTGRIMTFFTGMANGVLNLVTENVINTIHNFVTIVMMLSLMFWYSPHMTSVLFILIPGIIVPIIIINRKKNILTRTGFGVEAESITHITQSIEGIKTIQAFSMEQEESYKMDQKEKERIKVQLKMAKLSGLQTPILEIIISFGLCSEILIGGYFITSGSITTGDFTAFLLALTAAYKPAKSLTQINGGIQTGLIAAEGLFTFLDSKVNILDKPNAGKLKKEPIEIKIKNVSFAYNDIDGNVLNDISISLKPGNICALVGKSGGGKTTIFNLLNRFYEPQMGEILFNEKNINDISLLSLRQNISIVSQDVFLFNGTIAENIKYGTSQASIQQIQNAAKAAHADDFIKNLPNQYQNYVGERGSLLSGGQKQRIAIARAILKDAPILLLDEATSALDSQSEKYIQDALKNLMHNRTTFVIAHRLTTILNANIIYVIKNGKIIEQGTDENLMKINSEYKKLKEAQFQK